jgi:hypothetical protein
MHAIFTHFPLRENGFAVVFALNAGKIHALCALKTRAVRRKFPWHAHKIRAPGVACGQAGLFSSHVFTILPSLYP